MNVDKWITALQHPLVLAGFGLFIFAALIKPLFLNNKKLTGTATERLLVRGMNFAFALALLAIAGGLLLSWKPESKAAKPAAEGSGAQQPVSINNSGPGTVMVNNYGLSKEQYAEERQKLAEELLGRMRDADAKERLLIEKMLKGVQEQLTDLKKAYEEELERRKNVEEALAKTRGQFTNEQIKQVKIKLEHGQTKAAKEIFRVAAKKKDGTGALASYQLGQIAESELDYAEAMRQYNKAVALEKDNPEYQSSAKKMVNIWNDLIDKAKIFNTPIDQPTFLQGPKGILVIIPTAHKGNCLEYDIQVGEGRGARQYKKNVACR